MSDRKSRYVVLTLVLALGFVTLTFFAGGQSVAQAARWPSDDTVFRAQGWQLGPGKVETAHQKHFFTRQYWGMNGAVATLTIATSPEAKRIYPYEADVPYVGSGYMVLPAPAALKPSRPEIGAQVLELQGRQYLQLHSFGERRGLIGNGVMGWAYVGLDTIFEKPNDYYLATLLVPFDGAATSLSARSAVTLAEEVFPRVASWYGA